MKLSHVDEAGRARMVVVETAGRADYERTRAFYEARGYGAVSRIPDFYAPGDDQVVYVKVMGSRVAGHESQAATAGLSDPRLATRDHL